MKFITISGYARSGKDTTAVYFKESLERYRKKVLIVHFADYLKFICKEYFGWDGQKDEKGRTLLQYVGTDVIRSRDPTFWVKIICELAKVLDKDYDYIIVPDCRFPDEIDIPRNQYLFDTTSFWITRYKGGGSKELYDNGLTKEQREHPSESSLNKYMFDEYIANFGGLEELKEAISWVVEDILLDK